MSSKKGIVGSTQLDACSCRGFHRTERLWLACRARLLPIAVRAAPQETDAGFSSMHTQRNRDSSHTKDFKQRPRAVRVCTFCLSVRTERARMEASLAGRGVSRAPWMPSAQGPKSYNTNFAFRRLFHKNKTYYRRQRHDRL